MKHEIGMETLRELETVNFAFSKLAAEERDKAAEIIERKTGVRELIAALADAMFWIGPVPEGVLQETIDERDKDIANMRKIIQKYHTV